MKLEAEVDAFSAEAARGRADPSPAPSAQERASIGRPEWQPPGCGGCGSPSAEDRRGSCSGSLFDCEHFQFIDDDDDEGVDLCDDEPPPAPRPPDDDPPLSGEGMGESEADQRQARPRQPQLQQQQNGRPPRSVLKKPGARERRAKNRVTFDEAVALYSDENEGVQLLQLTTGPDVIYSDCYYMFEPPIEYRDLPPFDPPAEYRDSDETSTPTNEPADDDEQQQQQPADDARNGGGQAAEGEPAPGDHPQQAEEPAQSGAEGDVDVSSDETENVAAEPEPVAPRAEPEEVGDAALESDKVFERFLEAEREFAVDEELNSVFRALENDFVNDERNGALDDNFFRKLITLLSSAEGDPNSVAAEGAGDQQCRSEAEEDDSSQAHSRTLSEADSDCSISSQDTIIVRLGETDDDQNSGDSVTLYSNRIVDVNGVATERKPPAERPEGFDEVFSESASSSDERPRPVKGSHVSQVIAKIEKAAEESLSRQSSGEQSVNSATSQDHPQDADDSTSSDSRSGEVEEEIRLDDIGYDEEDAEDYDEESFRGIARGSSKIRRIIKKNALQCTLFRGIEAKRRQQPGAKYPRPKSPLLSQESLVEKLKWLTTMDDHKEPDGPVNFHSKPPDVILSAGGVPVNGSVPDGLAQGYQQHPSYYPAQPRLVLPPAGQGGYYLRRDGFPAVQHPSLPRQRAYAGHPSMHNTLPHPPGRQQQQHIQQQQWAEHQQQQQQQHQHQQRSSMTMPRSFRDWRVIQRLMGGRSSGSGEGGRSASVPADYVRSPNGSISAYPVVPPDVSRTGGGQDELEQFVEKDSRRLELIRRRYSVAETEEEDPTFGFARRPSVKGVQKQIHAKPPPPPSEGKPADHHPYPAYDYPRPAYERSVPYGRDPYGAPLQPIYEPAGRAQVPMHVHRASVALTELPGSATLPYSRKPPQDVRYHSYAESAAYGGARTLPAQGWLPPDPRTCHAPPPVPMQPQPPPMLQVPLHAKDERGVPEGASSSPKITSDSVYHNSPVPDAIVSGGPHPDDGMIYYSLNV